MSTEADAADPSGYVRRVEAVLFAAAEPLTPADIRARIAMGVSPRPARQG